MRRACPAGGKETKIMYITCLDMEGVLVPEIWIAFAEATGIPELKKTTRDEPDYDKLMKYRLDILKEHGLGLKEIQETIATIDPMPGAKEFLDELRALTQMVIVSDTFEQFAKPLMKKLNWPTLFCNTLEVAPSGEITGFQMRCPQSKLTTVKALQSCGFETIAATKVVNNNARLQANLAEGFVGIGLKKDDGGEYICDCSDLSEVIVISKDGKYWIKKVAEKDFFEKNLLYVGIFNRGDNRTIYNVIYRDGKAGASSVYYAKRFAITSITRDKEYDITQGTPGSRIEWFSVNHNGEAETVKIYFRPKPKLKKLNMEYDFSELAIKGKLSRGNVVTKNAIARISLKAKGISTIGGKDIWFDPDVQRINDEGRGEYLGQFSGDDRVLAVFKDGTYYTTSYDLSSRYQGELLRIEKYDENKVYAALYFDGEGHFYIKRFSFPISDNVPVEFIPHGKGTYLADFSADKHPQFMVTFTGRQEHRTPEKFDAEEFIGKKGIAAKGSRCHRLDVLKVEFIEPIHKPEDDEEDELTVNPGEEISLGPDDIPDDATFNPEDLYRPAEKGEEVKGDIGEADPDSDNDDEPNLFDI